MADITFADISEWQTSFDADAYLKSGRKVIIARAHSGYRADKMMPARRDYLRSKGFTAVGHYQYLAKDRDAAQQAREFMAVLGQLKPNEFPILDLEEGSGNQSGRAQAWFKVVDPWCGFQATLYSSESMFVSQLGGTPSWGKRPIWIAAYRNSYSPSAAGEPKAPHTFWQYSDRASFPGLSGGVDGNIFHGTAEQFLKAVRPGGSAPAPAPTPPAPTKVQTNCSVVGKDGRIHVFVELDGGQVKHVVQKSLNGNFGSWESLGTPGK